MKYMEQAGAELGEAQLKLEVNWVLLNLIIIALN